MQSIQTMSSATSANPAIVARQLSKVYATASSRKVVALSDVDFEIGEGEFTSLVGPSGCGKSTLMRMIAGLLPSTSGTLTLNGAPILQPGPSVSVVFQAPILLPWRTIFENVLLPIEFRKLDVSSYRARAKDLLDLVGLGDFGERYPHELSGGMQQRAAIVRALLPDPQILLMDEPFGALDAMTREQMNLELLNIWARSRKTVVFVTHSITESIFLSDRVLVMTSRPGTVAESIEIDLPRPRHLDMINTPKFGSYAARIRERLHAKGDLS
jgi:NitT/TauT family transport system ATP-binding protein